jgi:hypothetical protein
MLPAPSAMASPSQSSLLPVLGWREWVALPGLGVRAVKAKIDTGARSCALHAFGIDVVYRRGSPHVRFSIHPVQRSDRDAVEVEAEVVDERLVRSSTGHGQLRYVVLMDMELMDHSWTAEVTLAKRDQMGFRMLLGREALRGRFLVDPSVSYRAGRPVRRVRRPEPS